jgi:hypothetical protein
VPIYRELWVSGTFATFVITIDEEGTIIKSAPIGRKFIGQHLDNLIKFFKVDRIEILREE